MSVNQNVAIYGRTIIDTGNDGYVYAVTGALAWETVTGALGGASLPVEGVRRAWV